MNFSTLLFLRLLVKSSKDRIYLLGALKSGDQVAILVIQGQVRQVAYSIERGEKEFLITAYLDIGVFGQPVMGIELLHFTEWLVGGHDDLDVLEILK